MYYHYFMTTGFVNVDEIIEYELIIPFQAHATNLRILRSLELEKMRIVHFVLRIVNSQLFYTPLPKPEYSSFSN